MKILHVIASFDPIIGGPAEAIRNLIKEYKKLNFVAEVVCLDSPDASYLGKDSFPIHALDHKSNPWLYSPKLLQWLTENIGQFDIVIVHGLWLYPSYAVSKAIRRFKAKNHPGGKVPHVFIFPHGMLDPYFQRASGRKFKAIRNWIYWKLIERNVVNEADALLFTCETELLLARETFKSYHPKQEINVGYGINEPPSFSLSMKNAFLEKCPELANQRYLLFLSRINYKKGVDLLVNAYAAILEEYPEAKETLPKLVIAGPGLESSYGKTIKNLVEKQTLIQGNVFFPGMLIGNEKWGAIYGCEAFILPSHQENFGIAVAEALACGKPVLISNQINIWREIHESGSGIIANVSLKGTKTLLQKWLNLPTNDKQHMANQTRNTYEKFFHISQVVIRLNKVFESI